MNKFPIYPKYEAGDYCGYEFDPQTDFADFLSEARNHASEWKCSATPPRSIELGKNNFEKEVKKTSKKTWKSSLFSWLKSDKKKNQQSREPSKGSTINKPKRGCVSGPMPGISGPGSIAVRPNKPLSGPLTSLFSPMNKVDNEIPYLCLQKVKDSTHGVQSYGPVYLVT
ncbi:uncharacterized protein LOC132055264 [Lycium ferocissimum]|uniref:uncharacterized protein LOC132055264 n=1 Tax=Lycium ferocissimum TaxID=112874 RepID=UPI002814D261|nr:uncharacterized protein LOC132055264 [Lycium ferocissimum]XP_059302975.1 uncharacterized protein LOC132055264 [Lycium ferocissimum]